MQISEYFKGKDIFITGGSGFMGKALIEKLLRSCPDIHRIFILIREKKGACPKIRLSNIINLALFDLLRSTQPECFDKLVPITGNVMELGLGIKSSDINMMKSVSIIFHAAASVRFDDPLQKAIIMNARGTREVMNFAQGLSKIEVIVHVSTTYCYPERHVVEEKIYPAYANWKDVIKIAECFDAETLEILNAKLSKFHPNTYTFTKNLAEHIVSDHSHNLPVIIYRPSIVVSSAFEPVPGWNDNFNGPVGMLLASGIGILRTMHGDRDTISDYVPVDVAVKGIILAAYRHGSDISKSELKIYNCSTSTLRSITAGEVIDTGKEIIKYAPFDKMIWVPGGVITKCRYENYIKFILLHVLTAYLIDCVCKLTNQKPFLLKLQRRIYSANLALHYFATTHWTFVNINFVELDKITPPCDIRNFSFLHLVNIDIKFFFRNALLGARRYLLNEPDETIERAKKKFQRIYMLDKALRFLFLGLCIHFTLSKLITWKIF